MFAGPKKEINKGRAATMSNSAPCGRGVGCERGLIDDGDER